MVQLALLLVQIIAVLAKADIHAESARFAINILLVLLSFLAFAFVVTLLIFHSYLTYKNTTTNEYCKKVWNVASGNPFSK